MLMLLIFLLIGITIGYFEILPEKYLNKIDIIPIISIAFILFLMGSKIGMNPKIVENINSIGFKALLISIGSILGSLVFIKIFLGKMDFSIKKQEENK